MTHTVLPQQDTAASSRLYRAVWRWHFYAGLYVVPFLMMLAMTGLVMLWFTGVSPEFGDWSKINSNGEMLRPGEQADKALAAYPIGKIGQYIAPWSDTNPALVRIDLPEGNRMLAVDPHTGAIVHDRLKSGTWNDFVTNIHGEFLIGDPTGGGIGDFLIEVAASLAIILIVTGVYMWWPRKGNLVAALVPNLSLKGRTFWKSIHESLGVWTSVFLLFFLISGLAWAGVWGSKFTQAWSTFPVTKWDNVPLSDKAFASLNQGSVKEIPWTLEQTLLPQSGSGAGIVGLPEGTPVKLDSVYLLGRAIGFTGRFQVAPPGDENGVWTLSQDSMSYDSTNPTADRTVHIDQYSGKILADVKFADYPFFGKAMAVGIALHEGQLGWWNVAFNAAFCLSIITMCLSGVLMWWKRRPIGQLAAPRYPRDFKLTMGVGVIAVVLGAAFPLGGLAILLFAVIDFLMPKRLKEVGY
jgi:uncharacterized iron-regulated membrane protein